MISDFMNSREDFFHYYVAQDWMPESKTKRHVSIGDCCHKILLEAKQVDDVCIPLPDDCLKSNGHINPKPAEEFRLQNPDVHIFKLEDYERIHEIVASVRSHELGKLINDQDAEFEQVYHWTDSDTGLDCRMKADFACALESKVVVYDLKFTESIYPDQYAKIAKRFRYWLQDAHYSSGMMHLYGKPVVFTFWTVESQFPYRIAPRQYSPTSKDIARDAYSKVMKQIADCHKADDWRDDWTIGTTFLEMSPWDVNDSDRELEGFDD